MRTDRERKQLLQLAANLAHQSLTAFVLDAADERAERVIKDSRASAVEAAFFDEFFHALDAPESAALARAAERMRRSVRRD